MNNTVAKLLKKHTSAMNATDYTPAFVSTANRENAVNDTGVGHYTPTWFGVHNPSDTAFTVTIWTADQGLTGTGVVVRLAAGQTFYAIIAKLTVSNDVVLLGIPTTYSR